MNSTFLPTELWDLILGELSEINIVYLGLSRLLSEYFNELVLNNRNLKYKSFLRKTWISPFLSPLEQLKRICMDKYFSGATVIGPELFRLEDIKLLMEYFDIKRKDLGKMDYCLLLNTFFISENLADTKWLVKYFKMTPGEVAITLFMHPVLGGTISGRKRNALTLSSLFS